MSASTAIRKPAGKAKIANQKLADNEWDDYSQHRDHCKTYRPTRKDTRPDRDTAEVMKLVTQKLSAVMLAGEELGSHS
jgi:hypothetical protein